MKKVIVLFMVIAVVLSMSLGACQKKEAPKEETTGTQPAPTPEKAAPAGGYGEKQQQAPETPGYGEKKSTTESK